MSCFSFSYHLPDNRPKIAPSSATRTTTPRMIAQGIQNGASTHSQDHSIWCVSFNTMNAMPKKDTHVPPNVISVLFFISLFLLNWLPLLESHQHSQIQILMHYCYAKGQFYFLKMSFTSSGVDGLHSAPTKSTSTQSCTNPPCELFFLLLQHSSLSSAHPMHLIPSL